MAGLRVFSDCTQVGTLGALSVHDKEVRVASRAVLSIGTASAVRAASVALAVAEGSQAEQY